MAPYVRGQPQGLTFPDVPQPSKGHPVTVHLVAATDAPEHPHGLTAKQLHAVQLLASGTSKRATAEALKVERHTLTRWGQLSAFRLLLAQVTDELQADTLQAVKTVRLKALDTLSDLMDTHQPPQVRLQAARTALELQDPPAIEAPGTSFDEVMHHLMEGNHAASNPHPGTASLSALLQA